MLGRKQINVRKTAALDTQPTKLHHLPSKNTAINYHAVREAVAGDIMRVGKEDRETNLADSVTKILMGERRWLLFYHIFV